MATNLATTAPADLNTPVDLSGPVEQVLTDLHTTLKRSRRFDIGFPGAVDLTFPPWPACLPPSCSTTWATRSTWATAATTPNRSSSRSSTPSPTSSVPRLADGVT
ncbi:hypothetical protein ACFQX7_27840 [Luedemannella flava]